MSTLSLSTIRQNLSAFDLAGLGIPALVLMIMAMLVLPLHPLLLDILFTFNIVVALVIVMISIGTRKPLEFSSFPTVLLFATMLRLALNVASTRVILVKGHEGGSSAGEVIAAFGEFVIGGNYLVGFIIFGILMIINFIVVTKGAGRVSEVNARFTLDAMPGKQMAIDADLNAGVIDQEEAKKKREELSQEADFFGSMDGASKFVSGDAMAGLLILIINIVGGLAIGLSQHDLSFTEAGRIYVLLTIGDGLVAQIPSLFLSLATAIIVTRVTTSQSMTEQTKTQLSNPTALFIAASIMTLLGLVPGMPHMVFLSLAGVTAGIGYMVVRRRTIDETAEAAPEQAAADDGTPKELDWDDVDQVDLIGLEIGYGLIPLVNPETGGQLMPRVKGVRKKLSAELGFLVQPVRIRDALNLAPDTYHITLNGVMRGKGEVKVGKELAINPGQVYGKLEGIATKEPAFGLEAVWIDPAQRDTARTLGYTVVDASTAIATHLNKVLRDSSSELLSHDETQQLLDKLAAKYPKLVEDLVPGKLSLGVLTRTMQNLLAEGVSIRDMRTIVESLTEAATRTQDPDQLTTMVRPKLGRMIVQSLVDDADSLSVMTLDPSLEQLLHNVLQQNQGTGMVLEPGLAESLFNALRDGTREVEEKGHAAVLVVSPSIRSWLSKAARHRVADLTVLSYSEIPDDQGVNVIHTVQAQAKAS
ncbi:MAG: flagellar biosynthesis protein FlhA [Burkholderiaceae bacterium]|nr:flagellar biosynthesis protein FlhA [Burkholderiaceae bacterium]MDO7552755.1 flagellar biosynthesis protein FlhA [Burkholderiaceae bacterium]MDO7579115.1 flagellar biosynthesis protein FlhA [Burkholderiaceae bacterium]MDO7606347.1 flagellar biosynthesis protein FlhA [Burkholderiaceae bacterium]MDO7668361.1 flagellar biosynthesis protein FlhA [Burkholderiaceae bacterium]